jgi:GT2 family glycosyltransferase
MDVSILISLHSPLDVTRECLASLERNTAGVRYEVILADDGSTDGTRDFLRTLPKSRYRLLLNEQPRGSSRNHNAAARLASAPVLCLLHSDTVLMPHWLRPMLRVLRRTVDAGCVGNVHREPFSGLIDHIGLVFGPDGLPVPAGRNDFAAPREPVRRWPAVSGACCVVRKGVFMSFGGFDESFRNHFADVDFCLRAAEGGYRHYVANRSTIYHYVGASAGSPAEEKADRDHYRARWGARFLAFEAQRDQQRSVWQHDHAFSRENESAWRQQWELGRQARDQRRQDIVDARTDGRRYLRKHLARPWRYNFGRLCRALVQVAHPRPAAIPRPPLIPEGAYAENTGLPAAGKDWALFDPPQP